MRRYLILGLLLERMFVGAGGPPLGEQERGLLWIGQGRAPCLAKDGPWNSLATFLSDLMSRS